MTINRLQTDFFFAARTQHNENYPSGDFWQWAYNYAGFTEAQYDAMVDQYLEWEDEATAETLVGTNPDGSNFNFVVFPGHPRPPRKPDN